MATYRFRYKSDSVGTTETSLTHEIRDATDTADAVAKMKTYLKAIRGEYTINSLRVLKGSVWEPVPVTWEWFDEIGSAPLKASA